MQKKKTERYLEKPRKTIHKSKNVWHLCGPRKVEQSSCYSKMTKDNGKCANIDQYGSKIVSYQSSEVHRLCWVECVLCRKAFCILNDCLWLSSTLFTISREKVTNILKNSLNNELGQFCYSKTCYTVQMFPHKEAECFNYLPVSVIKLWPISNDVSLQSSYDHDLYLRADYLLAALCLCDFPKITRHRRTQTIAHNYVADRCRSLFSRQSNRERESGALIFRYRTRAEESAAKNQSSVSRRKQVNFSIKLFQECATNNGATRLTIHTQTHTHTHTHTILSFSNRWKQMIYTVQNFKFTRTRIVGFRRF